MQDFNTNVSQWKLAIDLGLSPSIVKESYKKTVSKEELH